MEPRRSAPPGTAHSGRDARQGEVVLRRRWQRTVFIGGLVAAGVLVLVVQLIA